MEMCINIAKHNITDKLLEGFKGYMVFTQANIFNAIEINSLNLAGACGKV